MKSLTITKADWEYLSRALFDGSGKESAGVLLCGSAAEADNERLLVRRCVIAKSRDYLERLPIHLEVSPDFYNRVIDECISTGLIPVIVHSHPHSAAARYSPSDDYGEQRLLPVLQSLTSPSASSMVISSDGANARYLHTHEFQVFESITILGSRVRRINPIRSADTPDTSTQLFSRQIQIFGEAGQKAIGSLKAAIVGVGGTGSVVAESLSRAGVRNLLLVDHDVIEESNLTRTFGAYSEDVGQPKVDTIGSHVRRLGVSSALTVRDSALKQTVLERLKFCDVVFCCVDNDSARAMLNRFAHQYLIPVIDLGVRLDARNGQMTAAAGRVSVVMPGATCLRCSGHVNPERIRAEQTPPDQRDRLVREGYILGLNETVPSINSLNIVIAGLAVTAGLNMFVQLTGGEQSFDQLYDATVGEVFRVSPMHERNCDICDEATGLKGLGDRQLVSAY